MSDSIVSPNTANLRGLCVLRSLVLAGQFAAVQFSQHVLHWMLPYLTLNLLLSGLLALVLFSWWRGFQRWPVTDVELFVHLCVDIGAFSSVLYFSGGANNPFISYLLVPLCISATTLPWRYTWGLTGLALTVYSLLLFHYIPLAAIMPHQGHNSSAPNIHILGMWANFLVSALLVTFFVAKMASRLRLRESELARSRERVLQDEQLLAVATLAAGTAHELGTPLSTMRVIAEDLQDLNQDGELTDDLRTMSQQIDNCKQILEKLVHTARDFSGSELLHVEAGQYFPELLDRWQLLRPDFDIEFRIKPDAARLVLRLDGTVSQAILNLLNNAADASREDLALEVNIDHQDLLIRILDRGKGPPDIAIQESRQSLVSQKQHGLGLGLLLSHTTAERFGGNLRWQPRPGGGSEVSLRLPLHSIAEAP